MKLDMEIKVEVAGVAHSEFTLQTILDRLDQLRYKLGVLPDYKILERGKVLEEIEYLHKVRRRKFPCNAS